MNRHFSDELIERYSMGSLTGDELADFEMHLIVCVDCQSAVSTMDKFLGTLHDTLEQHQRSEHKLSLVPPRLIRRYQLVRVGSPAIEEQTVGVLLFDDELDTLHQRFRRDWDQFAGNESHWLKVLPENIVAMAAQQGVQETLKWLRSISGIVKVSLNKTVPAVEPTSATVDRLYAEHIHPNILPFVTHLPQYSLEAAAGKFRRQMAIDPEGWVEVKADRLLTDDMFVIHIRGQSMEPEIPDGSLGAFRSNIDGSLDGKVLLIERYGEAGGSRYTVKLCRASDTADPSQTEDLNWLHPTVILESLNPAYEPLEIGAKAKIRALGEFVFVV